MLWGLIDEVRNTAKVSPHTHMAKRGMQCRQGQHGCAHTGKQRRHQGITGAPTLENIDVTKVTRVCPHIPTCTSPLPSCPPLQRVLAYAHLSMKRHDPFRLWPSSPTSSSSSHSSSSHSTPPPFQVHEARSSIAGMLYCCAVVLLYCCTAIENFPLEHFRLSVLL